MSEKSDSKQDESRRINPYTRRIAELVIEGALSGSGPYLELMEILTPGLRKHGLGDLIDSYETQRRRRMH